MMRYLGTHFSLTIGGLRLRVRIDLDDADDEKGDGGREQGNCGACRGPAPSCPSSPTFAASVNGISTS